MEHALQPLLPSCSLRLEFTTGTLWDWKCYLHFSRVLREISLWLLYTFLSQMPPILTCIQVHGGTKLLLYYNEPNSCNGITQQSRKTTEKRALAFPEMQKSKLFQSQSYIQSWSKSAFWSSIVIPAIFLIERKPKQAQSVSMKWN